MKIKTSKGSKRPRRRSTGKPNGPSAMSMQRKVTRQAYEAREIAQTETTSRLDMIDKNKVAMDKVQATYKPIRG